jgi:ABC-type multidrug transport system ATPase subunit
MLRVIEVENLSKNFKDIQAVNGLSFSVSAGEVYGFLGQNGAGKSTTIRMLLTLITPSSGTIKLFGLDLQKHRNEILRQVGAIIEKPDLYKYLTALENLRIFSKMSGVKLTEKLLMDQLDRVGLAERARSKVKTYSQGMKQRLGIAVALVHDPQLIILDEPTNGLDPQGIADIRKLIIHLTRDLGKTLFVSSHLLGEMEMIADSTLIIHKGKKIAEGRTNELLNPLTIHVEVITKDADEAAAFLRTTKWGRQLIYADNDKLLLEIPGAAIPELNKLLVEKGIAVSSLRPKHSLEDYFLSLTSHE